MRYSVQIKIIFRFFCNIMETISDAYFKIGRFTLVRMENNMLPISQLLIEFATYEP